MRTSNVMDIQQSDMDTSRCNVCLPDMTDDEWTWADEDAREKAVAWAEALMERCPNIRHVVLGWTNGDGVREAYLTNPECYTEAGFKGFCGFAERTEITAYVVHAKEVRNG